MTVLKIDPQLSAIICALSELGEDSTIPKNIRIKVIDIINVLSDETEISIRVNKVLDELEEIANDANIQPYTRTQVWNVISLLGNNGF